MFIFWRRQRWKEEGLLYKNGSFQFSKENPAEGERKSALMGQKIHSSGKSCRSLKTRVDEIWQNLLLAHVQALHTSCSLPAQSNPVAPRALPHLFQHLACLLATAQTGLSEGSKARKAGSHLLHPKSSHGRAHGPKRLHRNKS